MARTVKKKAPKVPPRRAAGSRKPVPGRGGQRSVDDGADFTIVGVGASAGGFEAFSALLRKIPADADLAIVFVQHLAPQHESALVELLAPHTNLPVVQVTEGVRIQRGHVYVIPPNTRLSIAGTQLHIEPRPQDRSQYTPIDAFFSSLADAARHRCIGVVLSGTASDGADGLSRIKAAGGVTVAQSPESAKYDGMPRAAIATGLIDVVLPPEEIGRKLAELTVTAPVKVVSPGPPGPDIAEEHLHQIFDLLRPVSGVDFRHYKLPTTKRRLLRRMALHRLSDPDDYIRLLRSDDGEIASLYQDLLIHVTRFFREPESFEALTRHVFPAILENRPRDMPIRVWVSGCATGEEAYSVAICLVEFLAKRRSDYRVQVFATDLSETAIEQARTGMYPQSIEADVSADRLRRFFSKHDGGFQITKMIRDLCIFARQDLTRDPPFSRLDLILCRNVLIYMDALLQKKLLSVFHYALNAKGFLVLGQAETVGAQATLFSLEDKKYRIHRKRPSAGPATMSFPVDSGAVSAAVRKPSAELPNVERLLQAEVSRVINDRFAPPGVVVDSDLQIVQFRGQTGAFLEPAPGQASLSLMKMAKEGLLHGLRSAVAAARKSRSPVRRASLQVRAGRRWTRVDLEVIPVTVAGRGHFLVLFDQHASPRPDPDGRAATDVTTPIEGKSRRSQVHSLERELAASREYLQSVIQELEAANEELQSANEEILSSNEELQSTNEELDTAKEELQSTNEELTTLNEELHGRNNELGRVNSDLVNLLGSVEIAIVIVGDDMRVRRFTPMAEKVLNLIPADVGRAIGQIKPNIEGANVEELIVECIEAMRVIEREVRDRQGRWYCLRLRPYRSADNRIDGAVLALFDIDAPKRYEASVRSATELAETMLRSSTRPSALLDSDWRLRSANAHFLKLLRIPQDGFQGKVLTDVVDFLNGREELEAAAGAHDDTPAKVVSLEVRPRHGASESVGVTARVFPAFDGNSGRLVLVTADTEEIGSKPA
jgi:two-component system, chemotaxis family, CheB/CheR fusion protein